MPSGRFWAPVRTCPIPDVPTYVLTGVRTFACYTALMNNSVLLYVKSISHPASHWCGAGQWAIMVLSRGHWAWETGLGPVSWAGEQALTKRRAVVDRCLQADQLIGR